MQGQVNTYKLSTCPSDEYDYSQNITTYQFRTGLFLVETNKILQLLVPRMSTNFPTLCEHSDKDMYIQRFKHV